MKTDNTYAIYVIRASVDTVLFRATGDRPDMKGFCMIPEFYVRASSQKKAVKLAKRIIDPLDITTMTVRAEKISGLPGLQGKEKDK